MWDPKKVKTVTASLKRQHPIETATLLSERMRSLTTRPVLAFVLIKKKKHQKDDEKINKTGTDIAILN